MAAGDAAAAAAAASALGAARAGETSPPASASQSKRDRKRQVIIDRLAIMSERLQHEKDSTYRDQLHKIQLELNQVQNFDPYAPNALQAVADIQADYRQTMGAPVHAENARSLMDMAGMQFPQFMTEMQDLLEIRDFQLTQIKVRLGCPQRSSGPQTCLLLFALLTRDFLGMQHEYERKVREYNNTYTFKVETAKREHEALNGTLRDRLINSLNHKKMKLSREKEAFDISETNALLLNPAQFSLANPGSPGGSHGKRSTRHRKDVDDLQMFPDGKKRKRNGADDDGSPAPSRRGLDPASTTPLWQSEKARTAAKQSGPLYSIDKLFTEKELSMHYNTSAVAAHQYILRHRLPGQASSSSGSDSGRADGADAADSNAQPAAPAMERQVSHATRSTRGGASHNVLDDRILGIEGIANLELPSNLDLLHNQDNPKMPNAGPQHYIKNPAKASEQANPQPLSQDDIAADLQVMASLKQYDQSRKPGSHLDNPKGIRRTFEAVSVPYQAGKYVALLPTSREELPAFRDSFGIATTASATRELPSPARGGPNQPASSASAGAAVAMSRQSSLGGVAMSRQGTAGSARGKGRRG